MEEEWICTDLDSDQYGREVSPGVYEFREGYKQATIDLNKYHAGDIEECILSYGYSLNPASKNYIMNLCTDKDEASWIIAECLFELKIK